MSADTETYEDMIRSLNKFAYDANLKVQNIKILLDDCVANMHEDANILNAKNTADEAIKCISAEAQNALLTAVRLQQELDDLLSTKEIVYVDADNDDSIYGPISKGKIK